MEVAKSDTGDLRTLPRTIVSDRNFILATRDTGYRNTSAAVAELIDNSLQAGAQHVRVFVGEDQTELGRTITIGVLDDGHGMSADTLQTALQFGGTERFDDRSGFGRFGMGLPNSSVSQTRRFDVYTWRNPRAALHTYLDVDEVATGNLRAIPAPAIRPLPVWIEAMASDTGTLVLWTRCDRLGRHRAVTVADRLRSSLGRLYRFAIWGGVHLSINETRVLPIDPLFYDARSHPHGAVLYGPPLLYELVLPRGGTSVIEIRFTELPVAEWHAWSTEEKRRARVVGAAGMSIVRAGREIDYGWHLMGTKRRENYDDWWRCEIRFSPELDELFGVTHSKQGVTVTAELRAILAPDLEKIARTLNARVRAAFERIKATKPSGATETASTRDQFLPVPSAPLRNRQVGGLTYRIDRKPLPGPEFYQVRVTGDAIVLTLNSEHPFFTHLYEPACQDTTGGERYRIECLLLAAARAELEAVNTRDRACIERVRHAWSDALATFLDE